jgi:hypothetical protein
MKGWQKIKGYAIKKTLIKPNDKEYKADLSGYQFHEFML